MTDNELLYVQEIYKKKKGFMANANELASEEKLIDAINLLLCHCTQEDPFDTAVGLKMVIERLGLEEKCHIWYDMNNKKMRLWYADTTDEG